MRAHPELRAEAIGNDYADKAASRVRESCLEPAIVQLSGVLASRTSKYVTCVKHLHEVIVRVHEAAQMLRNSQAFALDPEHQRLKVGDRIRHKPPEVPANLSLKPLEPKASEALIAQHLDGSAPAVVGLAQLLSHYGVAQINSSSGITWLEILVL